MSKQDAGSRAVRQEVHRALITEIGQPQLLAESNWVVIHKTSITLIFSCLLDNYTATAWIMKTPPLIVLAMIYSRKLNVFCIVEKDTDCIPIKFPEKSLSLILPFLLREQLVLSL